MSPLAPGVDLLETVGAGSAAIRGGFIRAASFVAGLGLTLAAAPVLIRHLGDVRFGSYAKVLAIVAIVAGLTEGGVNTIALRQLAVTTDRIERDVLIGDLLGLRLALSTVGIALAVGFSALAGYGPDLVLGTALAGLGLVLMLTQTLVAAVLQSSLRFGWAAMIELSRQAVSVTLIIAIALAGGAVVELLAVAIPAALVALVLTCVVVRDTITLRPAFHPRRWLPLLRNTAIFAIAVAVNTVYFRMTLVVLSLVVSGAQTGYFAISSRIMDVLIVMPGLLISAVFPLISRSVRVDRRRFDRVAGRMFELALFLGALLSMCVVLAAPFAMTLLIGSAHHPSVGVLQIQGWSLTASFVATATGYPLLSMHRLRETLLGNCVSLVVVVVLALLLAPAYGATGGAVATLAADFALATTNTVALRRRGGPQLPLSALAVTAVAVTAGYSAGSIAGVHPLLKALVGAAVFLQVLVITRRFPPELRSVAAGCVERISSRSRPV